MGRCFLVSRQTREPYPQHWAHVLTRQTSRPGWCKINPEKWCRFWTPTRFSGTIKPYRYGFTRSALQQLQLSHQIHSPLIPQLSTSTGNCTYCVYSAFRWQHEYSWYNLFNQADLMKQTIPSSLSPQATFCQTPKILAVPFSLPCGLGIAWFQQTCTSCYWNLELQWFCNHPSTSSTHTDVPYVATAVALKTFSLRITC